MKVFFKIVFLLLAFSCHSQEHIRLEAMSHPLFTKWVKDENIKKIELLPIRADVDYKKTFFFRKNGTLDKEIVEIFLRPNNLPSSGEAYWNYVYFDAQRFKISDSLYKIVVYENYFSDKNQLIRNINFKDIYDTLFIVNIDYQNESIVKIKYDYFDYYSYSEPHEYKKSFCIKEFAINSVQNESVAKALVLEFLNNLRFFKEYDYMNINEIDSVKVEQYVNADTSWNYTKFSYKLKTASNSLVFMFFGLNDKMRNLESDYFYKDCNEYEMRTYNLTIDFWDTKITSKESTKQEYIVESNYEFRNKELLKESFIKNADNNILRWIKYDGSYIDFKYDSNGILIGESERSRFKKNEKDPYYISKRQSNCSLEPYESLNRMLEEKVNNMYEIKIFI